jgi:ATP-dependent 26S proteasome regulatory subunit
MSAVRFSLKDLEKNFAQTENDIKAVQSVGQIIGEVMKQLDDERCMSIYSLVSYFLSYVHLPQSSSKHLPVPDT